VTHPPIEAPTITCPKCKGSGREGVAFFCGSGFKGYAMQAYTCQRCLGIGRVVPAGEEKLSVEP
jgi:DnaJ-class molecular chaperone